MGHTKQFTTYESKKRRSNWAATLEHLVPGANELSDAQLEATLWLILRPNRR